MKALVLALFACLLAACMGCAASADNSQGASDDAAQEQEGSKALEDGVYDIEVDTDSSMFHVVAGKLTVQDGQMTASIEMPGEGFSRLYFGTAEEAASAPDGDIYEYYLNDEGAYCFDVPVEALDEELSIAAWGQRRNLWYDHTITFKTPAGESSAAAGGGASDDAAAPNPHLETGEYQIDVSLSGGTGRANVNSPAKLVVDEDGMTATLVWSSSNFDQMVVQGEQYLPITTDGGSTFEIPVSALDEDIPVQAETTAMGEPHMIDYTLHFDSSSLK